MVKRRVMPSDPVPKVRLRTPLIARSGLVSAWDVDVGAASLDSRAKSSTLYLELCGEFLEDLSGVTSFELLVIGDIDRVSEIDRRCWVGNVLRCRPLIECVVTLNAPEFQALLTVVTAGRLSTLDVRFEPPRYGSAFIQSVRFNSSQAISAVLTEQPSCAQPEVLRRLDAMTSALASLARLTGARLTRAEMCNRLGVTSNTLTSRVRRGDVPTPSKDGKWLLAEVMEWESRGG
ncbi:helix-turn-helix transcriptional regulator [Variovorax paradoxus]|uniref:DNA-binding protein n=1 Tax=Variovorax paradoxus (strain EPS) TaxID=595537 RepID=E6V3S6_VARPE|nr:hypothetical protein [Variovorax paradoxus]ADU36950.1 hypothetical protein Varpa_2752 [Variovorax paradoxus EPS]